MKFELREILQLTGQRCKIYSVLMEGDEKTLFQQFVEENKTSFPQEVSDIIRKITSISQKRGAKEDYFRPKKKVN